MKLKIFETGNQKVVAGEITAIETKPSKQGNITTIVSIKGTRHDAELDVDIDDSMEIAFVDNQYVEWSSIIDNEDEDKAYKVGENIIARVTVVTNEGYDNPSYYGNGISKIYKTAKIFNVKSEEDGKEKTYHVYVGRPAQYSEVTWNDEKKMATATLSVRKYDSDTGESAFQKHKISLKNKGDDDKRGTRMYECLKNKKQNELGALSYFVVTGEPFVTDSMKKKMEESGKTIPGTVYCSAIEFGLL